MQAYSYCQSSVDNHIHIDKSITCSQTKMINVIKYEWV